MITAIILSLCAIMVVLCWLIIRNECPNCAHRGPHIEHGTGYKQCNNCGIIWRSPPHDS